jgi:hypothetical protein
MSTMEETILRSIKRYVPDLVDMAMHERPNADRGSIEVTAAVMLLIATIYMLNALGRTARVEAAIDGLIDGIPDCLDDRTVRLDQAILDPQVLERARAVISGANNTNLHGALDAIYNARVTTDIAKMGTMTKGPLGEFGGVCAVVGVALVGSGKTPDMINLYKIIGKHYSIVSEAVGESIQSNKGQSSCFIATACFDSPEQETVITLRKFRELVLKKHASGRAFVRWYYKVSPPIADAIRNHNILRKLLRVLLRGFAACIYLPNRTASK